MRRQQAAPITLVDGRSALAPPRVRNQESAFEWTFVGLRPYAFLPDVVPRNDAAGCQVTQGNLGNRRIRRHATSASALLTRGIQPRYPGMGSAQPHSNVAAPGHLEWIDMSPIDGREWGLTQASDEVTGRRNRYTSG